MTKAEFLSGKPFIVPYKDNSVFTYKSYKHGSAILQQDQYMEYPEYHCAVEKVTSTHIHVYTTLVNKSVKARILLSSLEVVAKPETEQISQ